jgi:predicted AAA+ superfamily ATPase
MTGLIPRHLLPIGEEMIGAFPAVGVEGARQVGKSTFASLLVDGALAHHVTLDDDATRAAAELDPRGFVEQAGNGILIIDEVQRHPDLLLAIKASIDRDRRPGRFSAASSKDLGKLWSTAQLPPLRPSVGSRAYAPVILR